MEVVFKIIIPLAVAIWTARLATTRGRNPWVWGGAALLLGVLPLSYSSLLGILPVVVLMFMKAPAAANSERPVRLACARCAQTHGPGQRFCTNCGWDLAEIYSPDLTEAAQSTATPTLPPPVEQVRQPEAPAGPAPAETVPPAASSADSRVDEQSPTLETPGPAEDVDTAPVSDGTSGIVPDEVAEPEPAHAAPDHLWGLPDPGVAPTAAVMTNRGLERLRDGRIQEAIDQFTKAIALDPDYREAWEHRAAAYTKQGKNHEAEQDLRRVQGLNPGPTAG